MFSLVNPMKLKCLAISKNATIRQVLIDLGLADNWDIVVYEEASHIFSSALQEVHFILLDTDAVGLSYLQLIRKMRKRYPMVEAMVIGGPKAKDVMDREKRDGVDEYYTRPIDEKSLTIALRHRLDIAFAKASAGFIGRSPLIEEIIEALLLVAPTEVPILIQGESGTGKDVLARTIHLMSRRKDGPFEAINCASLAEGVLESELFGHEKGSFTGAVSQRPGIFERAHKGTIFLDEVGEMSANMQVRLLRVLETGEVLRVGGVRSLHVDVRVVSATNRNLNEDVRSGTFRQDLFYRLKGVSFRLPALRERSEDIPLLVDHFIREANRKHGKSVKGIESDALKKLVSYSWPGNVRELKNLVDTLVVLSPTDKINSESVDLQLRDERAERQPLLPVAANRSKAEAEREMIYASILALHRDVREILRLLSDKTAQSPWEGMKEVSAESHGDHPHIETLSQMERSAIQEALRASGGNRRKAAQALGISERTLYRKINEYGLV